MQSEEDFETVIYHQKLAHKAWLNKVVARGITPLPEASELVWELLVSYGEALEDFPRARDDIYKTAYELATLLLPTLSMKKVFGIYRDRLVDAMTSVAPAQSAEQCRTILGFANVVSTAFADAQADLLKKESLHTRVASLSREMKLAKRIQMHLLPKFIPTVPGFDFAGRLIPAEEIGGDYWSVKYKEEDGVVTLKLADITGHGVAAATLVAAVKFISGGYYQGSSSAAEVMRKTNRILALETPHDILVTMAYAWLRPATRELTIVNAGHSPVFLCQGKTCTDIPLTGPALGVTEDAQYQEQRATLDKGDILFLGSDGITEAGTIHPFGTERLKKVVQGSADLSADEIADNVVSAVTDFVPNPHDDVSLLVVKATDETPSGG